MNTIAVRCAGLGLALLLLVLPLASLAQAIVPGFNATTMVRNDDGSAGPVPIGFAVNLYGSSFDRLFVNNNGNVTFDSSLSSFTPFPLLGTQRLIIAPFFADVDTSVAGNAVTYGTGTFNGRAAFGVNWLNVDYFPSSQSHTRRNSFQLILVSRSDRGEGDFDIVFNYGQILWEAGGASGGNADGLGGSSARAGYAIGRGAPGSAFELAGSAINGAFLNGGPNALASGSRNSGVAGRYVFEIRGNDATTQVGSLTPFANAPSEAAVTSGSGRYVVFQTRATNLVGGSTQGVLQIVRVDTLTGEVTRVSVDDGEQPITGDSIEPAVSDDGNRVVFVAADVAVGKLRGESAKSRAQRHKNNGSGVFLRDLLTGSTQRAGNAAQGGVGTLPQIAPGSTAVVYTRQTTSASEGQVGQSNVYIVPVINTGGGVGFGPERCVSCKVVAANGVDTSTNANGASGKPSVSGDGVWVAYETAAKNTIANSAAPCPAAATDVMLRNMLTGQVTRVSAPPQGGSCAGGAGAASGTPEIDFSGLRVVFESDHALKPSDSNGLRDVYLFDIAQSALLRVSETPGGASGNGASGDPSISGDGRFIAFASSATNLDSSSIDANNSADIHVKRVGSTAVLRLDKNDIGQLITGSASRPDLSFDGSRLAFESAAGNVAPGAVNGQSGVYQRANPLSLAQSPLLSATWWVPSESGWGMFTVDQGSIVAPGWFTYDSDGEPTWFLVPGALPQPDGSYRGPLLRFTGVPFDRTSGNAAESSAVIGSAILRFSGLESLSFQYTVGSVTQIKTLSRFPFGGRDLVCRQTTGSRALAENFSDLWWGGVAGSDGWGLHVNHIDDSLFATWYTYDSDREAVFLIAALQRQGAGVFSGPLLRQPNGTPFSQINGQSPSGSPTQVGTAVLVFSDGENATFETTLGGVTRSKPITRFQFGNTVGVCSTTATSPLR